jgi:hypothetical protein
MYRHRFRPLPPILSSWQNIVKSIMTTGTTSDLSSRRRASNRPDHYITRESVSHFTRKGRVQSLSCRNIFVSPCLHVLGNLTPVPAPRSSSQHLLVLPYVVVLQICCSIASLRTPSYEGVSKFPDWPPGVRTANGTAF